MVCVMPRESVCQTASQPALRDSLLKRLAAANAMRDSASHAPITNGVPDQAIFRRMASLDTVNAKWLWRVMQRLGWPGQSLVAPEGEEAAFLLVQHATLDTTFMVSAMPLLERAVSKGEAPAKHYALLFDRVAVLRGQPQRFGTQLVPSPAGIAFAPIDDSAHVDARRAQVGLMPLAEYARIIDSTRQARSKQR
jgi:hypothetical protein